MGKLIHPSTHGTWILFIRVPTIKINHPSHAYQHFMYFGCTYLVQSSKFYIKRNCIEPICHYSTDATASICQKSLYLPTTFFRIKNHWYRVATKCSYRIYCLFNISQRYLYTQWLFWYGRRQTASEKKETSISFRSY